MTNSCKRQEYVGSLEILAQTTNNKKERDLSNLHNQVLISTTALTVQLLMPTTRSREDLSSAFHAAVECLRHVSVADVRFSGGSDQSKPTNRDERVTDFLARHLRTWRYIAFITALMISWMVGAGRIDPYPFMYMNIALSAWIAVQESVVIKMMLRRIDVTSKQSHQLLHASVKHLFMLIGSAEAVLRHCEGDGGADLEERSMAHEQAHALGLEHIHVDKLFDIVSPPVHSH